MNRKRIWKYPLLLTSVQTLTVHKGSEILACQIQAEVPCLWIQVNPTEPEEKITIEIIATGEPMPDATRTYLGTVQIGVYVWHIFKI